MKKETEPQRKIRLEQLKESHRKLLICENLLREASYGYDNPLTEDILDTAKRLVSIVTQQIEVEIERREDK